MCRCFGQEAMPPVFSTQASLVLILSTLPSPGVKWQVACQLRSACLGTGLPAQDLYPGPVTWKRDILPLNHWASYNQ
ncbi:hypothetical protein TNCV_3311691 [Trichonephila clavipes]|nr:hypothetical protein TNCV_3311691 [Trichonephila clavipes]